MANKGCPAEMMADITDTAGPELVNGSSERRSVLKYLKLPLLGEANLITTPPD